MFCHLCDLHSRCDFKIPISRIDMLPIGAICDCLVFDFCDCCVPHETTVCLKQRNKHQHAQINKITDISFLSKTLISFSFCVFHFADPLCNKINARLNCLQIYSVIICYHRVNTGSFILFYCCQVTKNWRFFITNFSLCF